MEETINCYRCRNFLRYYTKGTTKFSSTKFGWCGVKLCTVESRGECEQYVFKKSSKKSKLILKIQLSNILTELSAIRAMLEVEDEGSKDENM